MPFLTEAIQNAPVRIAAFREAAVQSLARIRRKILAQDKAEKPPEYFVYFKAFLLKLLGQKIRRSPAKIDPEFPHQIR